MIPCAGCALQISTEWEMNTDNVLEWKLVDVPELGYFNTDKPFPRGELVLKTRGLIKGYFKHPKVRAHQPRSCVGTARNPCCESGPCARPKEAAVRHGFDAAARQRMMSAAFSTGVL